MPFTSRTERRIVLAETTAAATGKKKSWFSKNWLALFLGTGILVALTVLLVMLFRIFLTPAESLLDKGRTLFYQGHYTEATNYLRSYVIQNPTNADSRLVLAECLIKLQQYQPAAGYLRDLRANDPENLEYIYLQGELQLLTGDYKLAENTWLAYLGKTTGEFKARTLLGLTEVYFRQSRFDDARKYLDESIKLGGPFDPDELHRAGYLYGLFLVRDSKFNDAREQFKRTAALTPTGKWKDNGPVWWAMAKTDDRIAQITSALPEEASNESETIRRTKAGFALLSGNEYGLAEEQLVRVLQISPGFIDAQAYLGSIYWQTDRVLQAQSYLYTVLKADKNNRFARQVFVQILIDQIQNSQPPVNSSEQVQKARDFAQNLLQELIKERPDDVLVLVDQARLFQTLGKYDDAQSTYFKALELNDQKPVSGINIYNLLSEMYILSGVDPCGMGKTISDRALNLYPKDYVSWYWSGMTSLFCGKYNLAITQFQKSLDIKPYWPQATYRMAVAYQELGDTDSANHYYDLTADLEPGGKWLRKE